MKKRIFFVMLLILVCLQIAGAVNYQKTYLRTDEVWIRANRLCVMTGHLGPAPVFPTTGAEILNALERLDYNQLTASQKSEYDYLVSKLSNPSERVSFSAKNITIDPKIFLGVEFYGFSHLKDTPVEEFFIPYRDRIPFFYAGLDASFGDIAYVEMEYMYKDAWRGFALDSEGNVVQGDNHYSFSNFSFLMAPTYDGEWSFFMNSNDKHNFSLLNYQPTKAGASLGNDFMNFYIGRTRQSFGNGITGNLVIGDNFSFQEMMKLSFFSDIFSYYLSLTHFDNVEEGSAFKFDGLHQNRLIHRFDVNLFNKFRIAVNIGAHMVTDSPFDFRMFNPMMIVHNWCNNSESIEWSPDNRDEVNNVMGFEFEYAFYPGFMATAQVLIDQFRLPVEKDSTVPSAFGLLANVRYITPLWEGYLDSYFEAAYTSPYLYLNYKSWNGDDMYMLDHIVGYSFGSSCPAEISYSGYQYGPDAIVIAAGSEFSMYGDWSASADLMYMAHGEYGKESWRKMNNRDDANATAPSGIVEHTFLIKLGGSYSILDNLKVTAGLYTSFKWNYHNQTNVFRTDVQGTVGLSWMII